jgi:cation diffusion facilitator CzcD-associated flavoprotein CzcO
MARELKDRGEAFVVLERRAEVGGLWVYDEAKAREAQLWDGEGAVPVRDGVGPEASPARPMYRDLVTNLPKDTMAYADFDFPDDGEVPEFPNMAHRHVLEYVQQFAAHHGLERQVELRTTVRSVQWDEAAGAWAVASAPAGAPLSAEPQLRWFANVVVANGHHAEPILPELPGQRGFPGRVMHSCSYDSPDSFAGQRVLVLGGSVSAGQIAEMLEKAGTCAEVAVTTRVPTATAYRALTSGSIAAAKKSGVTIHKELKELRPDGSVHFIEGEPMEAVDVIVTATGFAYSFPFLDTEALDLLEGRGFNVQHLYKGIWYAARPSLSFIGLHNTLMGPAQLFEHQARAICAVIQSRGLPLPSEQEMERVLAAERAARPAGERLFLGLKTETYCKEMAVLSETVCTYRGKFKGVKPPEDGEVVRINPAKRDAESLPGSSARL